MTMGYEERLKGVVCTSITIATIICHNIETCRLLKVKKSWEKLGNKDNKTRSSLDRKRVLLPVLNTP
jgi:hypothetical protein